MSISIAKFTIDEYHQLIATGILEGRHVELLQGIITEMSPEGPIHSNTLQKAADWFRTALGESALIREAHSITVASSEPEPDIAIVLRQDYRERHPHADDVFLVIEIAYTSLDKDINEKRATYASAGIQDYWVVNLQAQEVMIFRSPVQDDYLQQHVVNSGTILPLSFPDLLVPVSVLLGSYSQ